MRRSAARAWSRSPAISSRWAPTEPVLAFEHDLDGAYAPAVAIPTG